MTVGESQTLPSKSGNLYTRRDLVIAVRRFDPYTGEPVEDPENTPKFTFFGERCRDLEWIQAGDIVTVHFDISGRSYNKEGKTEYFNDIRPLRVERQKGCGNPEPEQQNMDSGPVMQTQAMLFPEEEPQQDSRQINAIAQEDPDELPF